MTPQEKLDAAIKNNNINLLREAISEGCQIDDRPKGSGTYDSSLPNCNNTIYKAIEACVGLDFFQVLLENGAHIPEDNKAYIFGGEDYIRDRLTDALFHAVYVNGDVRDKKKNDNEQVINFIIENLSPEHSQKILSYQFGILYQALKNTTCSANVIDALIRKGAVVVNHKHDGSLNQLFHNRRETDQEMAKIAAKILDNGGIIYQDLRYPKLHSINRAVDSSRNNVGAETIKVLLAHGATVSEYTIQQVLEPCNYKKDVAELLVDNFTPPNPRLNPEVFFDQVLRRDQEIIDFVITHIFDPNLLEENHPKRQQMLQRLKEIDSKHHQQIKAFAKHSNAIGSALSRFPPPLVANITGYAADKNFAKRTGTKDIENKAEDMTNSYDKILQERGIENLAFKKMLKEQSSRSEKRKKAVEKSILGIDDSSDDEYGIEIEEVEIFFDEKIPNDRPRKLSASSVLQNSNQNTRK